MNNTDYKRAQRERERAAGVKTVILKLTADEAKKLEMCRSLRNAGAAPYQENEYISLLLINDANRLMEQVKELKPCNKCRKTLPDTCGGEYKTESACFLSRDYRQLNLTNMTCQTGEFYGLLTRHLEENGRDFCNSCNERYCGNCSFSNGKKVNF
jgi:hypothetical protein